MADKETISIKLRVETDEVYTNLILPLQQSKNLTALIKKLIRAYYDNEEVRNAVDEVESNQLKEIEKQLLCIQQRHKEALAQVMLMQSDIEQPLQVEDNVVGVKTSESIASESKEQTETKRAVENDILKELMSQMALLVNKVGDLENKVNTNNTSSGMVAYPMPYPMPQFMGQYPTGVINTPMGNTMVQSNSTNTVNSTAIQVEEAVEVKQEEKKAAIVDIDVDMNKPPKPTKRKGSGRASNFLNSLFES